MGKFMLGIPESFAEKIRKIYPEVYRTSFGTLKFIEYENKTNEGNKNNY